MFSTLFHLIYPFFRKKLGKTFTQLQFAGEIFSSYWDEIEDSPSPFWVSTYAKGKRPLPLPLIAFYRSRTKNRCPKNFKSNFRSLIESNSFNDKEISEIYNSLSSLLHSLPSSDIEDIKKLHDQINPNLIEERTADLWSRLLWYCIIEDHYIFSK